MELTSIHLRCDSTELHDKPITFTPNFVNSGINVATRANSVVHTGVKSFGCENKIPHLKKGIKIRLITFTLTDEHFPVNLPDRYTRIV